MGQHLKYCTQRLAWGFFHAKLLNSLKHLKIRWLHKKISIYIFKKSVSEPATQWQRRVGADSRGGVDPGLSGPQSLPLLLARALAVPALGFGGHLSAAWEPHGGSRGGRAVVERAVREAGCSPVSASLGSHCAGDQCFLESATYWCCLHQELSVMTQSASLIKSLPLGKLHGERMEGEAVSFRPYLQGACDIPGVEPRAVQTAVSRTQSKPSLGSWPCLLSQFHR